MKLLYEYLKGHLTEEGHGCPEAFELWSWVQGDIAPEDREKLMAHTHACGSCSEKLALIAELKIGTIKEIPLTGKLERRIGERLNPLGRGRGKTGSSFKTHLWFFPFSVFMALSFLIPEYFFQLLVLAIVSALKWLLDTRAHYTRIALIQRDLSPDTSQPEERLSQRLKTKRLGPDV